MIFSLSNGDTTVLDAAPANPPAKSKLAGEIYESLRVRRYL